MVREHEILRGNMINSGSKIGILMTVGVVILGGACGKKRPSLSGSSQTASVGAQTDDVSQDELKEQFDANLGLLNFRQLSSTYTNLTGVQLGGDVLAEYEKQFSALNKDNQLTAASAATISAVTKVAAAYCDEFLNNPAAVSQKISGVDVNDDINDTGAFARSILDAFYGPETILQGDRSDDIATVKSYVDGLRSSGVDTRGQVFGACTAVLASGEFYIL